MCQSHLLVDTAEVLQDVVHAALLQHLARMGLGEAVDPHAVHLVHLTLHEATAGLSDGHHIQQVGRCQQGLGLDKRSECMFSSKLDTFFNYRRKV